MELLLNMVYSAVTYIFMVIGLTTINNINPKSSLPEIGFTEGLAGWPVLTVCKLYYDDWHQKIFILVFLALSLTAFIIIWQTIFLPANTIILFLLAPAMSLFRWLIH
jgi:hypothetical protein